MPRACPMLLVVLLAVLLGGGVGHARAATATSTSTRLAKPPLLVQILFRHGDRTPTDAIPMFEGTKDAEAWAADGGLGQLTEVGSQQHYGVGVSLRQRYGGMLQDGHYYRSEVVVRSTDMDRTLMSAASQLQGWFPNRTLTASLTAGAGAAGKQFWRPIPIHTVPRHSDHLLQPYIKGVCPRYDQLVKSHQDRLEVHEKQDHRAPTAACASVGLSAGCTNRAFIAKASSKAGYKKKPLTLETIWMLSDTLFVRNVKKKALPEWASPHGDEQSQAAYNHLQDLSYFGMFELFSGTEERRLVGGQLLAEMLRNMHHKLDPQLSDTRKVNLYSAHDTNIAAFMQTLKTGHSRSPPYASAVLIELHSTKAGPIVKIFLKNESVLDPGADPHPLAVPGCGVECPLSQFESALAAVTPGEDYDEECAPRRSSAARNFGGLVAGILVVLVVGGGFAVLYRRRLQKQRYHKMVNIIPLRSLDDRDSSLRLTDDRDEEEDEEEVIGPMGSVSNRFR